MDNACASTTLKKIEELRGWAANLSGTAGSLTDFTFKWAARNGGIPSAEPAKAKLLADYRAKFVQPSPEGDATIVQRLGEKYREWAAANEIETHSRETFERFEEETGLVSAAADEVNGFAATDDLARAIADRCAELSEAAVVLGCDDATAGALKAVAASLHDVAAGRSFINNPKNWADAHQQAAASFQAEAISGVPLHRAWQVALDKLEHRAKELSSRGTQPAGPEIPSPGTPTRLPSREADRPASIALTPNEQAIFDVLTDMPMLGADVLATLAREGISNLDESALSRTCKRPQMEARGVRHRRGAGYYKVSIQL